MQKKSLALLFALAAAPGAAAQAPARGEMPWLAAPAAARAQLEGAGFTREAGSDTAATYTRVAGQVREQVYVRTRGGEHWNLTYSAVGDSATLQAKLDAAGADQAGRGGPAANAGALRTWTIEGGRRLSIPARPSRIPGGTTFQFTATYYRP